MAAAPNYARALPRDLSAGLVIFLVALPLCLGVALASGAPLLSGLVSGIVGGVLVAWLSGSHTSVSGPAAGLTAIVAAQIAGLGSFEAFLVAVVLAGVVQIGLGLLKAGALGAFFPNSVIKGLLSAIGILLILKQIPHLFGNDDDWLGDSSFWQPDGDNTFSNLWETLGDIHPGATLIGLGSVALLVLWNRTPLKKIPVPAPLMVVALAVAAVFGLEGRGETWAVGAEHLVQVPVAASLASFFSALPSPDFAALTNASVWTAAITIAVVASLETLLNLEAVDKLDPQRRASPPNRELLAQGVGNVTSGLLGGLPITSVVVRSSVGITAGAQTRVACFVHGALLLVLVLLVPGLLNRIPLSCLAAVLMVTGFKLATPAIFRQMWHAGTSQFLPFAVTITAIVLTDLLIGILIGLGLAIVFILYANLRIPLRQLGERDLVGDVTRIQFANQVSFLNRAALRGAFEQLPTGARVLLDARNSDYMDPDVLDVVREFEEEIAPAREIEVGLVGFEHLEDRLMLASVSTAEIQDRTSPEQVVQLLRHGNERFATGRWMLRDRLHEVGETAGGQNPLAVVLACMDSRVATEVVFDVGLGDLFSIRVAGNIVTPEALGSMEYGCAVAGAKLVLVMGHKHCGAVTATIDVIARGGDPKRPTDHDNLGTITSAIAASVAAETETLENRTGTNDAFVDRVALLNVRQSMRAIREGSRTLRELIDSGQVVLVGAVYDVATGRVGFLDDE